MKSLKKILYIVVAAVFFVQSCAFTFVTAETGGTGSGTVTNMVAGNNDGYSWSSDIVSNVVCNKNDDGTLSWSVYLNNKEVTLDGGKGKPSEVIAFSKGRNGFGVEISSGNSLESIKYYSDYRNLDLSLKNGVISDIYIPTPYADVNLNFTLNGQKLTFNTGKLDNVTFDFSYCTVDLSGPKEEKIMDSHTITISRDANLQCPLNISLHGTDVPTGQITVNIAGSSGIKRYIEEIDGGMIYMPNSLADGQYTITLEKEGYTFENRDISVVDGKIADTVNNTVKIKSEPENQGEDNTVYYDDNESDGVYPKNWKNTDVEGNPYNTDIRNANTGIEGSKLD